MEHIHAEPRSTNQYAVACNESVPFIPKTIPEIVAQIKLEILNDMRNECFSASLLACVDLHDIVDANYYGNFCDEDFTEGMIKHLGGRDACGTMPQSYIDLINTCKNEIHLWLESGQHHTECAKSLQTDSVVVHFND